MSAFILDDINLDYILTSTNERSTEEINRLGNILKEQNFKSVNYRYQEKTNTEPYIFKRYRGEISPLQVIVLCNCYDYQSSETDDYEQTEASKIIKRIRSNTLRKMPGYDKTEWCLSDEKRTEYEARR